MPNIRFKALEQIMQDKFEPVTAKYQKVSEYFARAVFTHEKMQNYLSQKAYDEFQQSIQQNTPINEQLADQIASAMKGWAMEQGATHYTHWFQPLNGATAEKHDAFIDFAGDHDNLERFSGKLLVQQEPDASSFPSGGMRNTFEARGYTGWDPTSPAFIIDGTLCIPTVFISYKGDSLDFKTPLLKSQRAISEAASKICQLFDQNVSQVKVTLGWEQEYFLVDERLYMARPDLHLTGRTLMGHASAKDQQMEDHYFGSIPSRVMTFIQDFEHQAHLLGIPVKTRHNEVAPGQFECAPMFEEVNLAVDHNQLVMDLMKKVARKHKFRVLLHEKPFQGVNGSGKHNNWSLMTDTGINLLSPGKVPGKNLMFLSFLVNAISAVYHNADILRSSIVSAGNQHRLGANEAPPAIISVFIGQELTRILNQIADSPEKDLSDEMSAKIQLNIANIPELLLDNTDRNRTSPFAFTGNRFEFRAVGSSSNCASPMIVLNTAMADQLEKFYKKLSDKMKGGKSFDKVLISLLRDEILTSKTVLFEGDGYSDNWVKEAEGRGLTNVRSVSEALKSFVKKDSEKLFSKHNVFTKKELEARYEISLDMFIKQMQIESRVLGDLAINHVVPTAIQYQNILIDNVKGLKEILDGKDYREMSQPHIDSIKKISGHVKSIREMVSKMVDARKKANEAETIVKSADIYDKKVQIWFDEIRYHIDKLELICDDNMWPLPKYRELLFIR
ncbi:MAG: glutamine synthetase type III [Salinivirgaceae bacterium]|nr:MAG: glutamine synthetase type III [Salinivirgaceae bacterium]